MISACGSFMEIKEDIGSSFWLSFEFLKIHMRERY